MHLAKRNKISEANKKKDYIRDNSILLKEDEN